MGINYDAKLIVGEWCENIEMFDGCDVGDISEFVLNSDMTSASPYCDSSIKERCIGFEMDREYDINTLEDFIFKTESLAKRFHNLTGAKANLLCVVDIW